jgi:DNA gyrase subunit A
MERDKVEQEYLEVIRLISFLKDLLSSDSKIYGVIRDELLDIKKRFGDARRTEIVPSDGEVNIEDMIADRPCIITVSHAGYIKRVPMDTYKAQRRGGKGVAGMATRDEDFVEHLFIARTHDYILFFTASGRVHWEKVYEIPEAARTARGKAIVNLLSMDGEEKIAAMIRVREFPEDRHLVMATAKGVVKKTRLAAFRHPRSGGIIAINIDPDDRLIGVRLTEGDNEILLATRGGMSIRFHERELRDLGRATRGVKGIALAPDDVVETVEVANVEATFLTCTENGYGKRTSFDEYRVQSRGGRGVKTIRTSERNGPVIGAHAVLDSDSLMLITANGKMIRQAVADLRVIGRATQGVRLINLDEGDKLVAATCLEPEENDPADLDDNGNGAEDGEGCAETTQANEEENPSCPS